MSKFLSFNKFVLMGVLTVAALATAVVSGVAQPASASSCTTGSKYTDFDGSYSGRDTMTVWTKGNKKLCNDVKVNFASFTVHNTYNGEGFKNNPTALPQSQFYVKTVTLKKGTTGKTTVTVKVPDECTDYQIDAYLGAIQTKITTNEGFIGTNAIVGKLFQRTKSDCTPVVKEITVCRLSDKKYPVTIKESEFDSTKYSKNPSDCAAEDKSIEVCRLSDKAYPVTIKESEFDSTKYSKDSSDCKEEVAPPELPHTGPAEAFSSLLGAGALTGTAATYFRSRRTTRG